MGRIFSWAFGMAMVAGTAESIVLAIRHFLGHQLIFVGSQFFWMAPVGYAASFLSLAILLGVLRWLWPRLPWERIAGFAFVLLAVLAVLLLFPSIHHLASLLLAAGIATRVAMYRPAVASSHRPALRVGRAGAVLALIIVVVASALGVVRRTRESRQEASLSSAPSGAPNVLLIILDTVRAANLSLFGYARPTTPRLVERSRESVVFDQAYSTAPWTLPSHAGIFTGHYPFATSTDWVAPLDGRLPTLAEYLRHQGYLTAGFVGNHYYTSWDSGLDRGFVHYVDYRTTLRQVLLTTTLFQTNLWRTVSSGPSMGGIARALVRLDLHTEKIWVSDRSTASQVAADFLHWKSEHTHRPWFAFLNFFDAHAPYTPPGNWSRRFTSTPQVIDRYDGAIAYTDSVVGALLDTLQRQGILDQTIVVIASDHGEDFGEHGLQGHGNSLYRTELHVPLMIRYPSRLPMGLRVDTPVSLRDLPRTIEDLARLREQAGELPGNSLTRTWMDRQGPRSAVVSEVTRGINTPAAYPVSRGAMRSVIDDSLHYIRNGDGVEELYAWRIDDAEVSDLARADSMRAALDRLRGALPPDSSPR